MQVSDAPKSSQLYYNEKGHSMSFQDKSLTCSDCGATFTFTAGEQEFYATKGLTNEPRRCAPCRRAKKQQREGADSGGSQRYGRY